MSFHSEDFGSDIVTLKGDDIFFLDTNIVINYLYDQSDYHEPTMLFLRYLTFREIPLCISEVVVMETLHVLSRELYVSDQISNHGGSPNSHRRKWPDIIKNNPNTLSTYNNKASKLFKPFLDICILVDTDEDLIRNAIDISVSTPLGSADALIVSSAINTESSGLLTLDRDMEKVNNIPLYTTKVKNINFNGINLIKQLGEAFKIYLIEYLGEDKFNSKYSSDL